MNYRAEKTYNSFAHTLLTEMIGNPENERPCVFLGPDFKELVTSALLNEMDSAEFMETYGYKSGLLCDMILENDYTCVSENEICAIYY